MTGTNKEEYANLASTTLNGAITNSATTLTVTSATGFPAVTTTLRSTFRITVESEIMIVTNVSGTTWTVTRGAEGTTAASHADASTVRHDVTLASLRALVAQDRAGSVTTANALDDEFDGSSLDSAYTQVTPSGSATFTVGKSVLSASFQSLTSSHSIGLVKPATGIAVGNYVEAAVHFAQLAASTYSMVGPVLSDGTTTTSNVAWCDAYANGAVGITVGCLGGTFTANGTGGLVITPYAVGTLYLRIKWSATNTFQSFFSIDGVTWVQLNANLSKTMTPTHMGIAVSNWGGGANPNMATVEYLRFG